MTAIAHRSSPVAIALQRCAKTFADGTRALEPLDLTINAGETIVFRAKDILVGRIWGRLRS